MEISRNNNPYFSFEDIESFFKNETYNISAPSFDKIEFGKRLKSARNRIGFRQSDLASLVGIDKITLSNYESGKRKDICPSIKIVYKLANVLSVSIDWLCGFSSIPDIKKIPKEVYREIYIKTMLDLMRRADMYKKYSKNKKYYKLPRRGPIDDLKQYLEHVDYLFNSEQISPNYYENEKIRIWQKMEKYSLEDIIDLTFNDKEYSMYMNKKILEEKKRLREIDDQEDILPF